MSSPTPNPKPESQQNPTKPKVKAKSKPKSHAQRLRLSNLKHRAANVARQTRAKISTSEAKLLSRKGSRKVGWEVVNGVAVAQSKGARREKKREKRRERLRLKEGGLEEEEKQSNVDNRKLNDFKHHDDNDKEEGEGEGEDDEVVAALMPGDESNHDYDEQGEEIEGLERIT